MTQRRPSDERLAQLAGVDPPAALDPLDHGRLAGLTDTRGRRVRTWSRLHLPSGEVGAEATALLVALPDDLADRARALYGPMA